MIPKIAIEAGFQKDKILTSDISLFSTILGYLFAHKPLDSIGFKLADQFEEEYGTYKNDIDRAAFLFWLMKTKQIKGGNYFEQVHLDHVIERKTDHLQYLSGNLRAYTASYEGISYAIRDLRDVIAQGEDKRDLIIINPPAYTKGYEKMFDFGDTLRFDAGVEEFNWNKEYLKLYDQSRKQEATFLWYRYQQTVGLPKEDLVFAREYTTKRSDYWLCTKPDKIKGFGVKSLVNFKKEKQYRPLAVKIVPLEYMITKDTKISFKQVQPEVALYYRDMWAHKLGSTKAERYFVMFLDGMVFGTVGFHLQKCQSLRSNAIEETYGFTAPLEKFHTGNRLLMLAITSMQFRDYLYIQTCKRNRIARMEQFKTTCLSKYRKVKLNNGLLKVRDREKMKNGMYKIVYITNFYDRSYKDCVDIFLDELGRKDE